jgi:hypothetical protein
MYWIAGSARDVDRLFTIVVPGLWRVRDALSVVLQSHFQNLPTTSAIANCYRYRFIQDRTAILGRINPLDSKKCMPIPADLKLAVDFQVATLEAINWTRYKDKWFELSGTIYEKVITDDKKVYFLLKTVKQNQGIVCEFNSEKETMKTNVGHTIRVWGCFEGEKKSVMQEGFSFMQSVCVRKNVETSFSILGNRK